MATTFCSMHEEVAAPPIFKAEPVEWWRSLVDISAGEGHGLRVGTVTGECEDEQVEILGSLPPVLRRGLKLAIPWWEPVRSSQIPWLSVNITWCPNPVGDGPRYAIPSTDALVGLLVARRKTLAGGAA